jgi:hypothetical protein
VNDTTKSGAPVGVAVVAKVGVGVAVTVGIAVGIPVPIGVGVGVGGGVVPRRYAQAASTREANGVRSFGADSPVVYG